MERWLTWDGLDRIQAADLFSSHLQAAAGADEIDYKVCDFRGTAELPLQRTSMQTQTIPSCALGCLRRQEYKFTTLRPKEICIRIKRNSNAGDET